MSSESEAGKMIQVSPVLEKKVKRCQRPRSQFYSRIVHFFPRTRKVVPQSQTLTFISGFVSSSSTNWICAECQKKLLYSIRNKKGNGVTEYDQNPFPGSPNTTGILNRDKESIGVTEYDQHLFPGSPNTTGILINSTCSIINKLSNEPVLTYFLLTPYISVWPILIPPIAQPLAMFWSNA